MKSKIRKKLYIENEYGIEHADLDARLDEEEIEWAEDNFDLELKELHRTCTNCKLRQVMKYEGWVDNEGETVDGFQVDCDGVPKHVNISADMVHKLATEKDISLRLATKVLQSTEDPVAWCEMMFGFDDENERWHIRPHQKEILRCNSMRQVLRWGRRSGKSFGVALKLLELSQNYEVNRGVDTEGNEKITGPRIMIVTPYQSQLTNIFSDMEMLVKRSSYMRSQIVTSSNVALYTKTPNYKMEFANEAVIKGFVSGTGARADDGDGGTIRGASAEIIYLDEMDLIPDQILKKVVEPILLTDPDGVMLLESSTPIGKRGKFYSSCVEDPSFKETYFPSTVLPQWDKFKGNLREPPNSEAFRSEYMAEFVEGTYGVFKPSLVHAARADYDYQDTMAWEWWKNFAGVPETSQLIRVIGIDWNKNAGSEFVVVNYDPNTDKTWVAESVNIPGSEYSSKTWKEEVIRLNLKWKPDYIYADEGYGHTIIEDLKVLSHAVKQQKKRTERQRQTAKLFERLVAFNFSQKIELKSPIDGTGITKSGKEYLVENAVRAFEKQKIYFPQSDMALLRQLLGYIVIRRSAMTGRPVYGPDDDKIGDHRLDALMLALAGLSLEFSIYSPANLPMSQPSLLGPDELKAKRRSSRSNTAVDLIKEWEKQGSGYVKFTRVERQGGEDRPPPHKPEPLFTAWKRQQRKKAGRRGLSRRKNGRGIKKRDK